MNLQELFKVYYNADTGNAGGSATDNNGEGQTVTEPANSDKDPIPYERFSSVVAEKNDYKTKYETLIQLQEQSELEAKEKSGEFENLYNELKEKHEPISQEFQLYKDTFQEILKAKLDTIPEEMRDLIPQGSELEQLKWIENATNKGLFKQEKVQSFGNEGNNPDTTEKKSTKVFLKGLSRF